jgi:hypothetical protein
VKVRGNYLLHALAGGDIRREHESSTREHRHGSVKALYLSRQKTSYSHNAVLGVCVCCWKSKYIPLAPWNRKTGSKLLLSPEWATPDTLLWRQFGDGCRLSGEQQKAPYLTPLHDTAAKARMGVQTSDELVNRDKRIRFVPLATFPLAVEGACS